MSCVAEVSCVFSVSVFFFFVPNVKQNKKLIDIKKKKMLIVFFQPTETDITCALT